MRDILFSLVVLGFLPACYRRPFIGLLMFSWLAYMRGQDLCWNFARYQRWSFLVAAVTMLGYLATRPKRWFLNDLRCWLMILLAILASVGVVLSDVYSDDQVDRWIEFWKLIGVALFTTAIVDTPARLRVLMWIIALSFGFYGVKDGLAGALSGFSFEVQRGPGGMLEDNNNFALALTMALPMLLLIGFSEANKILRRGVLVMIPLTFMTVVMTHSRGGFLALCATIGMLVWRSRNRLAGIALGFLVLIGALIVVPSSYVERIETIAHYEQDGSAMGRLAAWQTALNMARANPVFGVGLTLFKRYYKQYHSGMAHESPRVAHNSYLQIWAECGTPALIVYLLLIFLTLLSLWRIRRLAQERYFTSWILHYTTMFEAAMVGFIIGSIFLNRGTFDLFYHWIGIVIAFEAIALAEMAKPLAYPSRHRGGGEVRAIEPRSFKRRTPQGGFRTRALVPGSR
jgi:probable O-glycosylation ligase (exosortase A-associated)